jgi:hypothetical protein
MTVCLMHRFRRGRGTVYVNAKRGLAPSAVPVPFGGPIGLRHYFASTSFESNNARALLASCWWSAPKA